jgi:transposase-like protein
VAKILTRGDRTIEAVCEEAGVLKTTATNWVSTSAMVGPNSKPRGRMKWTPEAKLNAVVETTKLGESELGAYLRREGLYSNQVADWRAEIIKQFGVKSTFKRDERDDHIRVLEREILRKDKALAEASALLILEKKVALIWGKRDEDER